VRSLICWARFARAGVPTRVRLYIFIFKFERRLLEHQVARSTGGGQAFHIAIL
jgi:hypothetical protein